jgi:hypothetical protein
MSEFEYLAVFVSMIFGSSVTHVLAGAIRSIYREQIDETRRCRVASITKLAPVMCRAVSSAA